MAVRFVGVSKRYRNGPLALDSVTFDIARGSRTCLLGPNGAGKTTAIRLLQGLIKPTAGNLQLLGAEPGTTAYLEARSRTGIVPQAPGMYPDLTLAAYLELARRLYGHGDIARVAELLDLADHLRVPLGRLSGGFQRRACLAVALLPEPDLLVLDEPTVGLDPVAAFQVRDALRKAVDGRTVLLCTHNLAEAEALTDEVLILKSGRVVVHAGMRDLARSARPRLRISSRADPAELQRAIIAAGHDCLLSDGSVLVAIDRPEIDAPTLLRRLLDEGLDVYECMVVSPGLEELFLEWVRRS